ncbi:MAG: tetratricopeptide repeat-containing sensor histidine kinase [Bacteroidota bacterium]
MIPHRLLAGILFTTAVWVYGQPRLSPDTSDTYIAHAIDGRNIQPLIQLARLYAADTLDEALLYMDMAMTIAKRENDSSSMGLTFLEKGNLKWKYGDEFRKREATRDYEDAFDLFEPISDTINMAYSRFQAGKIYKYYWEYQLAVEYFYYSLTLYEMLDDPQMQANVLLNLGDLYRTNEQWDLAIDNVQIALTLKEQLDKKTIRKLHLLLADSYVKMEDFVEARKWFSTVMEEADEIDYSEKINVWNHQGLFYNKQGKVDSAFYFYSKALEMAKSNSDKPLISSSYSGMATSFYLVRNYPKALEYLDSSNWVATIHSLIDQRLDNYELYSQVYLESKDVNKAVKYKDRYYTLRDSVRSGQKDYEINYLRTLYQTKKKENENAQLQAKMEKEVNNKQLVLTIAGFLLLLLFFVVYLIFQKNKHNRELENQVNERTEQLSVANDELQQLNEELDTFSYRTTHDIRGPVARLLGLCQVAIGAKDNQSEMLSYLHMIHREAINMDVILHRFLEVNKIKHLSIHQEKINVRNLITDVIFSLRDIEGFTHTQFHLDIEQSLSIQTDRKLITILLKNLIENGIIYSQEEKIPQVHVKATNKEDKISFSIIDNGLGIRPEIQNRIFDMFFRGTPRSKGLGLGLYAANQAAAKLEASVKLLGTQHKYTTFSILLPKNLGKDETIKNVFKGEFLKVSPK